MSNFEYTLVTRELIEKIHSSVHLEAVGYNSEGNLHFVLSTVDNFPELAGIIPVHSTDKVVWMACYILFHLTKGHCFNDGNKRTAFVTTNSFLQLNGLRFSCDLKVMAQKAELIEELIKKGRTMTESVRTAFQFSSSNEYKLFALIFGLSGVREMGEFSSPIEVYPFLKPLIEKSTGVL